MPTRRGLLEGFFSLGQDINKGKKEVPEQAQGIVSDLIPELKLNMEDKDLLELKTQWEKKWNDSKLKGDLTQTWKENENYWLFAQSEENKDVYQRDLVDNLIFESFETFLPLATRRNPEPVVSADNTAEGEALSDKINKMLIYLADILKLRLRLKRAARYWGLYHLGVAKVGWSFINNEISLKIIRPQKLILDPDSTIEEGEYTGKYIGETRKDPAEDLITRFPDKSSLIKKAVNNKLGTEIAYQEWWTNNFVFWTLKDEVLGKAKNPHWNYPSDETTTDEFGEEVDQEAQPINHFQTPRMPYEFLSIFNIGKHPYDDTSLIKQNLAAQDLTNKRLRQIDKNVDGMNGGWAISLERAGLTKEEATRVIEAARKGGGVAIPRGDVNAAISRIQATALPADVFNQLIDTRNELRNNFGVRGSTPEGTIREQTVRGKIIIRGQDNSRIGLISEYLEQFSDGIFNWFVQLMLVYYDEKHVGSVLGREKVREFFVLQNTDIDRKILVSVKEGSMIPKDDLTQRNEAIDLWSAGGIDPISLFDKLGFPNPRESAKQLFLWQSNPISLFPDLQQQQQVELQQLQAQQSLEQGVPGIQGQQAPQVEGAIKLPPI